jgi:hypothetical protein
MKKAISWLAVAQKNNVDMKDDHAQVILIGKYDDNKYHICDFESERGRVFLLFRKHSVLVFSPVIAGKDV